jgi:hypothetical protein
MPMVSWLGGVPVGAEALGHGLQARGELALRIFYFSFFQKHLSKILLLKLFG